MANMQPQKVPMPTQEPKERSSNFKEVALGYTEEMAILEATRCLNCKNRPCVSGCPVNVQIPDFIQQIAKGDFEAAYQIVAETNALPAVCGRVCPQENQCEKNCVRAIKGESVGIGRLERFVADWHMEKGKKVAVNVPSNGRKVAVIGSGPAGLTCAGDLAKLGYSVTIFEAFHVAGGVLMYGIPEFRLPKAIVQKEIEGLKALGVCFSTNMVVGKIFSIDELLSEGFEAVFVGSGAGLPSFLNIEGESLNGVYSANEFLTRINLMKAYRFPEADTPVSVGKSVAVIGGGNVTMDAARCAKRLGAENVYVVYRRSRAEMPARLEEIHHAEEEGIQFKLLSNPTRILGDEAGFVTGIECVAMELGEPDASGRRRPVAKVGSEFVLDVETVIIAVGQTPNPLITQTTQDLDKQSWGGIVTDENGRTSKKYVYAGGDAVTGAATVILAMGAGKKAAAAIHEDLQKS